MGRIVRRGKALYLILAGTMALAGATAAQTPRNAMAQTRPMGWNSWNKFACNVSEDLMKSVADAMASNGMKNAGYEYVVIDDCWQVERDADGNIVPDAKRFPSRVKALGDYVHSKGLKFGIYSDAGSGTCQNRPGSQGHKFQDALMYAKWGVDYLKFDWCHTETRNPQEAYTTMNRALQASGRPIVLSICEWGKNQPWVWGRGIGNLWRTTDDISDHWQLKRRWLNGNCREMGMLDILDLQVGLEPFAGPGHWNDPDMLEVGDGGMTNTEYRSHFSLWVLLAAPLIAGNDIRSMTPEIQEILTNKEVIAVDQDPLGREWRRVRKNGDLKVWSKEMSDGSRSVILLNRGSAESEIGFRWPEIGYPEHVPAKVRDL